jgi:hypothetical protein
MNKNALHKNTTKNNFFITILLKNQKVVKIFQVLLLNKFGGDMVYSTQNVKLGIGFFSL